MPFIDGPEGITNHPLDIEDRRKDQSPQKPVEVKTPSDLESTDGDENAGV